jgi:predicted DCC family thiol-disulfide oxidoreductase YuxK
MIEQTDHPIVLFDGVCNFCDATVRFIVKRDPAGMFQFAAQQSEIGQKLLAARGLGGDPGTLVVFDRHHILVRSDAALFIVRRLSGLWPALGVFGVIPRRLRDGLYDWFARHRYQWFGKKNECPLPPATLRSRFIER